MYWRYTTGWNIAVFRSARSNWLVTGSTTVASSVVSVWRMSHTMSRSRRASAARILSDSGNTSAGLPPITNNARTLPVRISSASAAVGRPP